MSEELKEVYDKVYEEGKETFHTFSLDLIYSEVYKSIRSFLNNRKILDLGSGDGDFIRRFITLENFQEAHGYDFSNIGIQKANEDEFTKLRNIKFRNISFEDLKFELDEGLSTEEKYFDIITSIGVIEHLDNIELLFYLVDKLLKDDGIFVLEHPNFLNVRGIIWKTLEIFVGAEMSKTDKHTILPDKVFEYMEKYNLECEKIITFDHSRGLYDRMVEDLSKRIKLALEGKVEDLDNKVRMFLDYLQFITHEKVFTPSPANGAECIWVIKRKSEPINNTFVTGKENIRNRKINLEIANEIRTLYKKDNYTQEELAKKYNLTQPHISEIINNKQWG